MGEAWYPNAIKDDQGNTGGTMKGGPPRGVIHTSEGYSPRGGRAYYHFTVGQNNRAAGDGQVTVYQWRPVTKAARGLRNLTGGTQTNREGDACIQVAFAWKAARINELPDSLYEAAKGIVEWAQVEHNIPLQSRFDVGHGNSAYGYGGTARMTVHEWDTHNGWCGHQEVPENTHWDPGTIDWVRLLDTEEEDEMSLKKGDKGKAVTHYQNALLAWDPNALPQYGADGDYGNETVTWVTNFQTAHDLDTTGAIDGVTADMLSGYLNEELPEHDHPHDHPLEEHTHTLPDTTGGLTPL